MTRAVNSMTVFAAEALPKMKAPALMIYGEKDALLMARPSIDHAKSLNPSIRSLIYPESGHAPFLEEAERFNRDLSSFRETVSAH